MDAADPRRRRRLVPAVQRARRGQRPRRPLDARRAARRRLPRDRAEGVVVVRDASPTGRSRSCAPTPTRRRTRASRCSRSRWTRTGVEVRPLRQITGEQRVQRGVPRRRRGAGREPASVRSTTAGASRTRRSPTSAAPRSSGRSRCCTSSRSSACSQACARAGATRRPARAPAARAVVDRRRALPAAQRAHARPARARRGDRRGVEPREAVLGRA